MVIVLIYYFLLSKLKKNLNRNCYQEKQHQIN